MTRRVLISLFLAGIVCGLVGQAAWARGTASLQPRLRITRGEPLRLLPPGRSGRFVFGVMGSAAPEATIPAELRGRIERLGQNIAQRGDVVLTGACPGMPQVAARAAKLAGGYTVGISPAGSLREHCRIFKSPVEAMDVIKMTGTGGGMGLIARERDNIGLSDILVFAGGRSGTLGELIFALQERRVVALLEDSTGVTAKAMRQILPIIGRGHAVVVADRDPDRLVQKAVHAAERLRLRETKEAQTAQAQNAQNAQNPLRQLLSGRPSPALSTRASAFRELRKSERERHQVVTFFGSSRGMDQADRGKVSRLAELIATGGSERPRGPCPDGPAVGGEAVGGRKPRGPSNKRSTVRRTVDRRKPLLLLPTRRGLGTEVARIARRHGVRTVGVSPAGSAEEHNTLRQLSAGLDEIRLTGEGGGIGKLAAYQHCIKPAEVVFVAGGDHETLGGTIFAMYQPTVLAVLETGGMTGKLRSDILSTFDKPSVARMVFDTDPDRLYQKAMAAAAALRQTNKQQYVNAE